MQPITRDRDHFDGAPGTDAAASELDVTGLLGTWVNCNVNSCGIVRADIAYITGRGHALALRPYGGTEGGLIPWGSAPAAVLSDDVSSLRAIGLTASFDQGFQRVLVVGYLNRGHLSFETATIFTDGSARAPYLTRHHFYRLPR
ncbi:hypothetical protein LZC95_05660 [Pendulispora brunnea]|uniref:Lipocalin-like domain-containing protein n=1 Tax=Pendulispora brunnea TaxID=2905690 RepID=A0ABZ2KFP3_9BACT